ncbi:hypothetical protein X975_09644, partial [Stegodyphus mimosarum]
MSHISMKFCYIIGILFHFSLLFKLLFCSKIRKLRLNFSKHKISHIHASSHRNYFITTFNICSRGLLFPNAFRR